jgi:AcrR family transcriptional regulator
MKEKPIPSQNASAPGAPSPRQLRSTQQKAETRERLYRAAVRLFASRGLAATTVEDITREAGVAKGTFFNYFRSKEQVLGVLAEIHHANVRSAVEAASTAKGSVKPALQELFRLNAAEFSEGAALTRALFSAVLLDGEMRKQMKHGMATGRQMLQAVIVRGQENGELRTDRTAEELAVSFQQSLVGVAFVWCVQEDGSLTSRMTSAFESFWAGAALARTR